MVWNANGRVREALVGALAASFLRHLPTPIVDTIQNGAVVHHVPAGRVFVDESEPDWVGIVVSGLARVYLDPPDGPEITVRYVRPGAAVGVAALAGTQHPVSVRAITPCLILQLNFERLRAVVADEPAASQAVARELAARLFDAYAEIATHVRGSVRERLAAELLEVIDQQGETDELDPDLTVTHTHEALAEGIGSAREVVSKALEAFAREGMVELGRGSIRLVDPVQLHLVAHKPIDRSRRRPNGALEHPAP